MQHLPTHLALLFGQLMHRHTDCGPFCKLLMACLAITLPVILIWT